MTMIKIAWKSKLIAYPVVNQKKILRMAEISKMAHTSMENVPTDFYFLMRFNWETYPMTGPIATAISNSSIIIYISFKLIHYFIISSLFHPYQPSELLPPQSKTKIDKALCSSIPQH